MVKFKRRQVLLAGVTTGVTASVMTDYWRKQRDRQRQAELETLAETQRNSDSLLQQAFQQDAASAKEIRQITTALRLTPPTMSYSHERSKLLIQCSKLATQQYIKGKIEPTYDGTLTSDATDEVKWYVCAYRAGMGLSFPEWRCLAESCS